MKNLLIAATFGLGLMTALEAAPTDPVTQADLKVIFERLAQLEAQNKAQAARIAELEGKAAKAPAVAPAASVATAKTETAPIKVDKGTEVSDTGKIFTTSNGKKYYLADASAKIFEPLTESGLQFTPYGYLVLEGVYSTRPLEADIYADWVKPEGKANHTVLSVQDSILGMQFMTPEAVKGWKFSGKAEFDLAGANANDYAFHWRHLYVNAEHESGWSILAGQTWHLWKMVTPSEIDGAWMENTGHPYRRSPQIRVTKKWDWEESSFEARVGIVKGGPGMGGDRDSDSVEDNTASAWALVEGALIYDRVAPWQDLEDDLAEQRWLIGLGGMYGNDRSHRLTEFGYTGQEDEYKSMMGMLAASVPFGRFTLKGQFYAGQDLGGIQAGCGQRVSYNSLYGRGNEVRTIGGFVDLGYKLNDTWSFAIGYGADDPVDGDVENSLAGVDKILFNDRIYADVFYSITANFRLGLEYARLMTSFADGNGYGTNGGDYDADRIQFSAFYDF